MTLLAPPASPASSPPLKPPDTVRPFFSNRPGKVNFTLAPQASNDEAILASEVRGLFEKARAHRRPLVGRWNRHYQILRNGWLGVKRESWMPTPDVPEIYPIIASVVGWMTDQRPTIQITPSMQSSMPEYGFYDSVANDLKTTIYASWINHFYDAEIEKVIWDAFTYGTGIFKACWDASLDGGLGNAVTRRIDPYTFYPDPQATSMENANYFIEVRTMSLQEMDRRWPGSAKRFSESGYAENVDESPTSLSSVGSTPKASPGAIAPNTSTSYGLPGQSRVNASDDIGVTIFEAWLREHYLVEPGEGNKLPSVVESWRVVVVVGNFVLMDEAASELWGHERHPYTRYVMHETGEFWGLSLVELLTPSQIAINRLLASIQQNVELTGNPVLKETTRAGIPRTKIPNKPGARLAIGDGGQVEWLSPPMLQPTMFSLIQFYIGEMERISGLSAIARGNVPTSRNSEQVLDRVQEASFVRVRLALRNLEWALRDQCQLLATLIVENYTLPRMVATVGKSAERSMLALTARHFYVANEHGATPMKFSLLVEAGSSLPTSQQAHAEEANVLYAMGALDDEELLKAHKWPGWTNVVQRVEGKKASGMMQPPGARQRTGRKQ